ncbi:potassium-transporting ATPase subunit KdpC [Lacrimispora defluvii]|uniref:Potassium-transporting ATPase KdpC subunit n=1 Tax=Lacrimispora defluvii TaxID=2719233 RepID=A0ABX1VW51_9FIRM|nr:potassium-transporting ATPase subunit KdpC [Lacrimispora defluvii]NNJ31999.1 potassium-transporting ATPase subunit KdpC [Lacrimispora defluvii]
MKTVKETLQRATILVIIMTVLCGLAYPLMITGISQVFYSNKANGSIIEVDGKKYGSELLGQQFTGDEYLWGRIMNINTQVFSDKNGDALMYASPSNINTTSEEFANLVDERVSKIKSANPDTDTEEVPVDLVTSSGSGLDPQISYAAANYQIERIAVARGISTTQVQNIIDKYTTNRFVGVFGENVVNVLKVNLALDGIID